MQKCYFVLCTKNFALPVSTAVYKILYTAFYNISRCRVQSRYCHYSHPDQGCTKRVQPGNVRFNHVRITLWSHGTIDALIDLSWIYDLIFT